jgi:hypothetical protein
MKGKKTAVRAIRIAKSVDEVLELEAEEQSTSVNGLVSSALTKFAEWDRYAERFGFVTLPNQILRKLVSIANQDIIADAALELGPELLKSEVMFRYKEATIEKFLEWLSLITKYSGLHKTEIAKINGDHIIVLKHELGQNWSIFLSNYFASAFKEALGMTPDIEINQFQVLLTLHGTPTKNHTFSTQASPRRKPKREAAVLLTQSVSV